MYEDKVIWDVISIEASHMLLGRSWQLEKQTWYERNGHTNKYTFVHQDYKITHVPSSTRAIGDYQNKIREKKEGKKEKKYITKMRDKKK